MATTRWKNNTTFLFVLAVFLAWPTFGLSFLVLLGWVAWTGYSRGKNAEKREHMSLLLEPLFAREHEQSSPYSNFIGQLELPIKDEFQNLILTSAQLEQCGRLVTQYFAHNPREATAFVNTLHSVDPWDDLSPGDALGCESQEHSSFIWGHHSSDLRLVCFRAVKALMTNNDLSCFEPFDLDGISAQLEKMSKEQKAVAKRHASIREEPSGPISQKTSVRPPMEVPHKSPKKLKYRSPNPKPAPWVKYQEKQAQVSRNNPSNSKNSISIVDHIAAQDAENGTNLSAWLNLSDRDTPKISEPKDNSQAIIDEINAKAFARSQGRMEAVRNGAAPRTASEREYARELSRIKKLARKL
jgi:hypothetical protein|tara:strand:- start:19907 stop:20971 length:1065 start_codon:yes stop_codon:yes gene_type:complete